MCVYRDWIYTSVFCPHPSIWCHFCANHALRNRILQEKLAFLLFAHQVFVVCFLVFTSKTEKKGTYFSHPGVIPFFLPAFVIKCVCCVSPSVGRFRFSGGPLLEHSLWHCIFFRVFLSYAPPVRVWKVLPGPVPIYQVAGTFGCIIRLSVMLMMSPAHSNTPA